MENIDKKSRHHRSLFVLFITEMWERFGYYLMVGILFLYLTDNKTGGKGFDNKTGADIVGTFIALVYLTPFIGGLLADRYLGYIKSIFLGGALLAAGYIGLAIPGDTAMFVSLGLICVGNGFFKPNISTILGNIYNREELKPLKDNAYNIFYMGVNIGALFCNFAAAYLRNTYGWGYAFAAAGVGLILGLIWLATQLKHVREGDIKKPLQKEDMPMSKILLYVFLPAVVAAVIGWVIPGNLFGSDSNDAFMFACVPVILFYVNIWRKAAGSDKRSIGALLFIFAISIIFWTIYNQNSTGLTIWAQTYTDRKVSGTTEQIAGKLGFLEKVTDTLRQTDKVDARLISVTDTSTAIQSVKGKDWLLTNGNLVDSATRAIQVPGPDPYYNNVPKAEWPNGKTERLANTELFQSINPFFIVVLTPILVGLLIWLRKRRREPTTSAKFGLALFISGLSALAMVFAVMSVPSVYTNKTAAYWLFITYFIFTISEILLSPIGLSFVSKLSPPRLTALMMGGWFLSTSLGGKVAGVMASQWDHFSDKKIFFLIIAIAAFIGGIWIFARIKSLNAIVKERTGSA